MNADDLKRDAELARQRNLSFEVCVRQAQTASWEAAAEPTSDLVDAHALACGLDAWRVGVFAHYADGLGGFLYWTNQDPDLLNSDVITMEVWFGKHLTDLEPESAVAELDSLEAQFAQGDLETYCLYGSPAVRVVHQPTGLMGQSDHHQSQVKNKIAAIQVLKLQLG